MKNLGTLVGLAVVVLVVGAIETPIAAQTKARPKAGPKRPATPEIGSTPKMEFDSALLQPAKLNEKAPDVFDVKFVTTKGDFVIRVTRAWAPLGADRFYNLAKHGFYNDATFFRVLTGFVVQFGISAHPQVSAVWQRATIPDDPVKQSNRRGFVTFATGGPNTRTTQVFINLGNNTRLDGMGFSPFGEVVEGMDVVEKLHAGYGEGAPQGKGPRQDLIQAQGRAYLEKGFPQLDKITSATVTPASVAAAPKAPPAKQ